MNAIISIENPKYSLITLDLKKPQDFDQFIFEDLAILHQKFLSSGGKTPPLKLELNKLYNIAAPFSVDALAFVDEWSFELFPHLELPIAGHYRSLLFQLYDHFERSAVLDQLCQRFQISKADLLDTVDSNLLLDWMTLWLVHTYPCTALFLLGMKQLRPFLYTQAFCLANFVCYLPVFMLWEIRSYLHHAKTRQLTLELASGKNVRHVRSSPFPFNRKMAHLFVYTPPAMPFVTAIWRAIVLAWGGSEWLVLHLQNHFSRKTREPDFIQLLVFFFRKVNHQPEPYMMKRLLGYIQHRWDEADQFSLKGWTMASLQRKATQWYQSLQQQQQVSYLPSLNLAPNWTGALYQDFILEETNGHYEIIQLNSIKKLEEEGRRMMHCVGLYAARCQLNGHSIWSLRQIKDDRCRSLVTIEINREHRIIQARKMFNANPEEFERQLIRRWALREGLKYQV